MKVAVITGAGSGIGRAVGLALARRGWATVLAGRRTDPLREVQNEAGPNALACPTDVTDAEAVEQLFEQATKRFSRVDMLFNNAGIFPRSVPLDEVSVEDLHSALNINVVGSLLCARAAMRVMKAQSPQGGRIINNGSVSAYAPRLNAALYTVSKNAITGLTKALILEGRNFGIACGQVDIGNAVTELSAGMAAGAIQADGRILAEPRMALEHAVSTIVHMAELPPEANCPFVTVMATGMPLYGRG